MRRACLAISVALAAQLVPPPAAAQSLAAKGPWTLSADAESCVLRREFVDGENLAYLELRRFYPGDLQMVVASNTLRATETNSLRYRLNDDQEWRNDTSKVPTETSTGYGGVIFFPVLFEVPGLNEVKDDAQRQALLVKLDLDALEQDAAAKVGTLTLLDAFDEELSLQVGSLARPLALMNDCVEELMSHWNIDAEAHKTLSRGAAVLSSRRASLTDFPPLSSLFGQYAPSAISIRLDISEKGKVENCHFYKVGGDPGAAAASCAKLRRGLRFEPALDKDGEAIASFYTYRLIFPRREPSSPSP